MGNWHALASAVAALLLSSCFGPSKSSPELLPKTEGLTVAAFEARTMDVQPDGSVELLLNAPAIAVTALSVDTIGASGKVKIEVANLYGTPSQLGPPPAAEIYQYIQVGYDNLDSGAVATVTINFQVARAWIDSNEYSADHVALERHSGTWIVLPTRVTDQNAAMVSYQAISPGLSLFAITTDEPAKRFGRSAALQKRPTPIIPKVLPYS